jgi:Ser/Thr protein kinase RdoA (MazF antagonist)
MEAKMTKSHVWGEKETEFFFSLTPERILDAVEASGLRCTGRCFQLNSMENRVYEVELELDDDVEVKSPSERFRIVKFYRPGRWSKEQILEEHQFLLDLEDSEIRISAPERFSDGETLHQLDDLHIWYAVFPKVGGRSPDELSMEQAQVLGRLIARLHNIGAARPAEHRVVLDTDSYGRENLEYLLANNAIPLDFERRFREAMESIIQLSEPWFQAAEYQKIHGDAHLGNLLVHPEKGMLWVDFDDCVRGPCVQDLWLVTPGRDEWSHRQREWLLDGYTQMRDFDRSTLRLIEPLRALRMLHFHAWIHKRWQDPAFPRTFPHFGSMAYWQDALITMEEQMRLVQMEAQRQI